MTEVKDIEQTFKPFDLYRGAPSPCTPTPFQPTWKEHHPPTIPPL